MVPPMEPKYRILFVCMGNICRSPTAEGVFRAHLARSPLAARVAVDSAGTLDHHQGEPPDPRTQQAALRRGYDLSGLRARAVTPRDFDHFDLLAAMDHANVAALSRTCPPEHRHKLTLFLDFAPEPGTREVPDPYYGGPAGFEQVLDLTESASQGLLLHLERVLEVR